MISLYHGGMAQADGSSIRWQATTIAQLGYAVNLTLTLATASLGFALNVVRDKDYAPTCWGKCFWMGSAVLLGASIALGVWCVLNRLRDFRQTTRTARCREGVGKAETDGGLDHLRAENRRLGKRTWTLFFLQIATFCAGALFLAASFVADFHAKLF